MVVFQFEIQTVRLIMEREAGGGLSLRPTLLSARFYWTVLAEQQHS
jgi:hypothetical protein